MSPTTKRLDALCKAHPKFLGKGGLCVGLVVTETAREKGLPLDPKDLRTQEGGQVAGLGKAAVQKILEAHEIKKVLAEEGGRTSRGSLGLMEAYVKALNELHDVDELDLKAALDWWIQKVRAYFASEGPKFQFDPGKSLRANIEDLLNQAEALQAEGGGTNYVGAMLQHLVGAKLDLVLGEGKVGHHGFSVADHSTSRKGDYQIDSVAIHVTTHPSEALIRKVRRQSEKRAQADHHYFGGSSETCAVSLKGADIADRVDVLDTTQFLTIDSECLRAQFLQNC